jgi:hypothetical protein
VEVTVTPLTNLKRGHHACVIKVDGRDVGVAFRGCSADGHDLGADWTLVPRIPTPDGKDVYIGGRTADELARNVRITAEHIAARLAH